MTSYSDQDKIKIVSCVFSDRCINISKNDSEDTIEHKIKYFNSCTFQEKIKNVVYQGAKINISAKEVLNIRSKVVKYVKSTESYARYSAEIEMKNLFGHKMKNFNAPASIKIFSRDLICYNDGENWRNYYEIPNI